MQISNRTKETKRSIVEGYLACLVTECYENPSHAAKYMAMSQGLVNPDENNVDFGYSWASPSAEQIEQLYFAAAAWLKIDYKPIDYGRAELMTNLTGIFSAWKQTADNQTEQRRKLEELIAAAGFNVVMAYDVVWKVDSYTIEQKAVLVERD